MQEMKRCKFDPWIRKISWRRAWQPAPVLLPGIPWTEEPSRLRRVHRVTKSWTWLKQLSMHALVHTCRGVDFSLWSTYLLLEGCCLSISTTLSGWVSFISKANVYAKITFESIFLLISLTQQAFVALFSCAKWYAKDSEIRDKENKDEQDMVCLLGDAEMRSARFHEVFSNRCKQCSSCMVVSLKFPFVSCDFPCVSVLKLLLNSLTNSVPYGFC